MATIIDSGPNQGYYRIPNTLSSEKIPSKSDTSFGQPRLYLAMRDQQLALENEAGSGQNVYYRYSPGPDRDIVVFNDKPPYVDGYYYVRRDDSIDLRQKLYALENKAVPSTGNTEIFNTAFADIKVPADYCPYYVDPCPFDWCARCRRRTAQPSIIPAASISDVILRWIVLFIFVLFVAFFVSIL